MVSSKMKLCSGTEELLRYIFCSQSCFNEYIEKNYKKFKFSFSFSSDSHQNYSSFLSSLTLIVPIDLSLHLNQQLNFSKIQFIISLPSTFPLPLQIIKFYLFFIELYHHFLSNMSLSYPSQTYLIKSLEKLSLKCLKLLYSQSISRTTKVYSCQSENSHLRRINLDNLARKILKV